MPKTYNVPGCIQQLGLNKVENFSDDEKLLIYRQYENLTSIHLEPRMIHLVMKDGRDFWASPGHPTVDGRTVGELRQTAIYDSAVVSYSEVVPYDDTNTYDLLPAGNTGFYWADGIPLASTLR